MTHRTGIAQVLLALLLYCVTGFSSTGIGRAAPLGQACEGQVIPGGCFFSQTTNGQGGYIVLDDPQARFWTEYQRLGGAQTVGYPISRRFVYDGFITQAFQKLVLQWRPEVGIAYPMNVFDELSYAGHDPRLFSTRQTPYPLVNFDPPGATWAQIVSGRQALLNANVAIRTRYFSFSDPLNVFGLPTSRVEDMGNHYAVRTQRAVFQQWKEAVPWAGAGEVTIANGGDIAKEVGWFDPAWLVPEGSPGSPPPTPAPPTIVWEPRALLVSAAQPGTLYLLQSQTLEGWTTFRLMFSRDGGTSWGEFIDGTVPSSCIDGVNMDYNTPNEIYIFGCDGLYRWDGGTWVQEATIPYSGYVVQYGNRQNHWAIRDTATSGVEFSRSDDGGQSWRPLGNFTLGARHLVLDSSTNRTLYGLDFRRDSTGGPRLVRMDSTLENSITPLEIGTNPDYYVRPSALTLNGANGDLFVAMAAYGDTPMHLWLTRNADEPDVNRIEWELRYDGRRQGNFIYLSGGSDANGRFVLYAIQQNFYATDTLLHSYDEGLTWQAINTPQ